MFDKILIDFDGTICDRSGRFLDTSIDILNLLESKFKDNCIIVSGNSYESISNSLSRLGVDIYSIDLNIWADCNSILFRRGVPVDIIESLNIANYKDILYE